ncbi:MAG: hypothetical protein P4N60_08115 [Verrucomicrobiae bacterium]|nr:hypothetical protein [Verrucomicrobiae bacterium]
MIQAAKFNFKTESSPSPSKGGLNTKVVIGVMVHVLAVAVYLYVRYLTNMAHHRVMTSASRAVVAAITSAAASTAAASKTEPVAANPELKPAAAAAVNPSNSVPAKATAVSLGDSLMAVLSPSAKAETVQPPLPPLKTLDQPEAVPAARQVLKVQTATQKPVHRDPPVLTDAEKLAQIAHARFASVIDMAIKNPDAFGFASGERVDAAKLGDPIVVYTISAADRKSYQAGQPLQPLLHATNEWIFPVMLDGSIRYMLPVKRVDKGYVAGPGSRALAMVFDKIQQRWPASEGFHPQLVANANITSYFFTIPELPAPNLTDTGDMFQYNPTLSPASVILASWH